MHVWQALAVRKAKSTLSGVEKGMRFFALSFHLHGAKGPQKDFTLLWDATAAGSV
jgi:hypothetical protein